jgi:NTP pyrophosphatase (non-canonical NTP hydrolase)
MIGFKQEEKRIIEQTIDLYGTDLQCFVACEELAELIQAISKALRTDNDDNKDNLIEEMADVYIILEQLQELYTISDELINEKITEKLERQDKRNQKEMQEIGNELIKEIIIESIQKREERNRSGK